MATVGDAFSAYLHFVAERERSLRPGNEQTGMPYGKALAGSVSMEELLRGCSLEIDLTLQELELVLSAATSAVATQLSQRSSEDLGAD